MVYTFQASPSYSILLFRRNGCHVLLSGACSLSLQLCIKLKPIYTGVENIEQHRL